MGKVLLLGGSPMIGKSTVAKRISSMYETLNLSTDDIGEILQTIVDINPMKDINYLDYYEYSDLDVQIRDMQEYHKNIENAIMKMINIHSNWGESMVIEGYAIYPQSFTNDNVDAVWLIATDDLLKNRLAESAAFELASDTAKENYLNRSIWHNRFIEKQCKTYNCKSIVITGAETVDEVVTEILGISNISF